MMTHFDQLELPEIAWSTPSRSSNTNLYLGLDNFQPSALRAFALASDGFCLAIPAGGRRFKDFDTFQAWWDKLASHYHPAGISTTKVPRDPFGSLKWLESQRLSIRRYHSHQLTEGFMSVPTFVPRRLHVAYGLALRVIYECEISVVVDMAYSNLCHIQGSIKEMEQEFRRIRSVTPCPF